MGLILALAGLLAAGLAGEGATRVFCGVRAFSDVRRNHHAWTAVRPNRWDEKAKLSGLRPDYHAAFDACGRAVRYDTAPAPNPVFGLRLNEGASDLQPVYGVIAGDSFTEGRHVDGADTFAARLSDRLGKRFVNAGRVTDTAGPTEHLAYLRASGLLDAKPKVLLLQLNPTDIEDEARLARRGAAETPPGPLRSALAPLLRSSALAFHLSQALLGRAFAPAREADLEGGRRRVDAAIDEALALGKKRGFSVLVLVDDVAALAQAAAHAKERGVFFDAGIADPSKHFLFDGHLNEAGHDELSLRLSAALRTDARASRRP